MGPLLQFDGAAPIFISVLRLFWTSGRWYILKKFFVADMEYLLQPDQIIYKDISSPHFYEWVGAAAQGGP